MFRRQYRHKLHQLTFSRVEQLLQGAAEKAIEKGVEHPLTLILLCFEDLALPGVWCHRQFFAEWYAEQSGQTARELVRTAS